MPDLDAVLATMRERAEQITGGHDEDGCDLNGDTCTGHDAVRLIKVASAVLKLADGWTAAASRTAAAADRAAGRGALPERTIAMLATSEAESACAQELRSAVEAALAGEAGTDAG